MATNSVSTESSWNWPSRGGAMSEAAFHELERLSPDRKIEVLSPSTEARDRGVKFKAYQGCPTMQEIVLMSQFAQYVEIWQRDDQDIAAWNYRHYGPGEIIEINSIDVQIDIAGVYQGLDFAEAEPGEE